MDQRDRAGFTSLSRAYWLESFWGCCKRSERAPRDCNILYKFLWRYVHSYQDSFNPQQWQTMVHCKTQTAPSGQRRCLQEGDRVLYKQAKYTQEKEIWVAKRTCSNKLRIQLSSRDSVSVWKGKKNKTSYKTPSPSTVENQQQADNLNEFYCRLEKRTVTAVESFRFLGTTISQDLKWDNDLDSIVKKAQRR